ncbi:MAG: hypothetical protein OHK0046_14440 [Anaerolineae bacterium]
MESRLASKIEHRKEIPSATVMYNSRPEMVPDVSPAGAAAAATNDIKLSEGDMILSSTK